LGRSGQRAVNVFQCDQVDPEIALGQVGIILALEASRLAATTLPGTGSWTWPGKHGNH